MTHGQAKTKPLAHMVVPGGPTKAGEKDRNLAKGARWVANPGFAFLVIFLIFRPYYKAFKGLLFLFCFGLLKQIQEMFWHFKMFFFFFLGGGVVNFGSNGQGTKRYLAVAEKCYEGAICTIFDLVTAKMLGAESSEESWEFTRFYVFSILWGGIHGNPLYFLVAICFFEFWGFVAGLVTLGDIEHPKTSEDRRKKRKRKHQPNKHRTNVQPTQPTKITTTSNKPPKEANKRKNHYKHNKIPRKHTTYIK